MLACRPAQPFTPPLHVLLRCLPVDAQELAARLRTYYTEAEAGGAAPPEGPFAVSYEDALPLEDYLAVVGQHFAARQAAAQVRTGLEDRAIQFRNVEKRLLMRFKVRHRAPGGGGACACVPVLDAFACLWLRVLRLLCC